MKEALPLLQERYEALKQQLLRLEQAIALPETQTIALKSAVTTVQQFFHQEILQWHSDDFAPALQQSVQSYQVETDKQLRLLGMDVMFLQAARQSETRVQRSQRVRDRLHTLTQYCEAVLAMQSPASGDGAIGKG